MEILAIVLAVVAVAFAVLALALRPRETHRLHIQIQDRNHEPITEVDATVFGDTERKFEKVGY